ncbi:MAG: hypothetical protein KC684_08545 [Candidatus Omnitrophica bacterium]|nr:hypothetical protein [Candidatus Omnitrophota bacterium]
MNILAVGKFLSNFSALSAACVFQVFESIMIMGVSFFLIKSHYEENKSSAAHDISVLPSGIFFVGLFLIQTYLFYLIEQISFFSIALLFALANFTILFFSANLSKAIFKQWETRIEIKIIVSFLQMLLAMFLPLIVSNVDVGASQFNISFKRLFVTGVIMGIIFLAGFLKQVWFRKVSSK